MRVVSISFLIFFTHFIVWSQNKSTITGNFQGVAFYRVIELIEDQSEFKFYYTPGIADSLFVSINAQNENLEDFLTKILANTKLQFAIDRQKNVYITLERKIAIGLPNDFFDRGTLKKTPQTENFDFSEYERLERAKKVQESKLYSIGTKTTSLEGKATIAGSVRDAATGEPVIGATIFIENPMTGAATDQFGYYSLLIPKGRHELKIKSVGMRPSVRQVMLYSTGKLDIELEQEITPLKEVVIESQAEARVNSVQMGTEKLDIAQMKQIPLALGETDVMKVVLTLPGVQSVGEGTAGINVRGGATNQNLMLLNDAVVYNPSHLFGFFSTFNPDILKNVELYKSGIKAEYGGRLSSVLDVHTREGNLKKISGSGGISPVTTRLSVEGPIVKDKTSFIIGGRTTYSNWLLRRLNDPDLKRSTASFYDITGGITHKIDDNNNLYFSGYLSKDKFSFARDTAYEYSDRNASIKWKHIFNNRIVGVLTGTASNYRYTMSSGKNAVNAFSMNFSIKQFNAKADFTFFVNSKHTIDVGLHATRYGLSPGTFKPLGSESQVRTDIVEDEQGLESAAYISDQFEVNSRLSIYAGLRYSFYNFLGPKHINIYAPNAPLNSTNIVKTVKYSAGETIAFYHGAEPRLSVRYSINTDISVKLSFNRMRQYIQMLSNTTAITPTDIWKLSDSYIKPQVGDQYSIGFYKNIRGKNLIEASVEAYYKIMQSTIDYKNGSVLLMNHHLETDVLPSRGTAYGAEFLIKKNTGKINGWLSYTYSRSFMQTRGTFTSEMVNGGQQYRSNFDKPHAINFIGNYKFSRRFNFSLNVIYATGRPITLPIVKYEVDEATRVYYSDRNAYRIPNYFRTDISVNIEGNHKIKKLAHSSWTFAIYNLTGRENAYSVFFVSRDKQIKGYKLSIFARPIPTITYNFRF